MHQETKLRRSIPVHLLLVTLVASAPLLATSTAEVIDIAAFLEVAAEVEAVRDGRLLSLEEFQQLAADRDVVLLDARSAAAFSQLHLAGAVNLTFADMTETTLRRVLGDRDRTVLIYCNNNFMSDEESLRLKAPPAALNLSTFMTLWTYGYHDVYELGELLETDDPRLSWEGRLASTP